MKTIQLIPEIIITKSDIETAINGALVTRGKRQGQLKAKCPPVDTPEAAAWQAMMSFANPFKCGMGHALFMGKRNRLIYNSIRHAIEVNDFTKHNIGVLDSDRRALEAAGVW